MAVGFLQRREFDRLKKLFDCLFISSFIVKDVLLDGVVEECGLLVHESNLLSEVALIIVFQPYVIKQDPSAGRLIKALKELDDSRLTASRMTYDAYLFSCFGLKTGISEDRLSFTLILKGDVVELD